MSGKVPSPFTSLRSAAQLAIADVREGVDTYFFGDHKLRKVGRFKMSVMGH